MVAFPPCCRILELWPWEKIRRHAAIVSVFLALTCLFTGVVRAEILGVVDQAGRAVRVPENPRRVIALTPSITEIIFALGQEHRLRGVAEYSDFPPAARHLPRIGSYVHPNLEMILALQPDLALGVGDGNPRKLLQRLENLGVPVYLVDPRNLSEVMDSVIRIGQLLGTAPQAREIVAEMRRRVARVQARVRESPTRPRVFFQIGVAPIVSVGTNTFIHELIDLAGGQNVTAGSIPYPAPGLEHVLGARPDVIIITSMTRGADFQEVKAFWSRWPCLPAVQNRRIHLVDSDLFDRPTPRLVEGLELLSRILHPELVIPGGTMETGNLIADEKALPPRER